VLRALGSEEATLSYIEFPPPGPLWNEPAGQQSVLAYCRNSEKVRNLECPSFHEVRCFLLFDFGACSGAEIGRFVAMLRNGAAVLRACAAFALLQVISLDPTQARCLG